MAASAMSGLQEGVIQRRSLLPNDVAIQILFCGICHSDLHAMKNERGSTQYPFVPGHEIVGVVEEIGAEVSKFKVGQNVAVGCLVDSCLQCENCEANQENYCMNGTTPTYNGLDKILGGRTFGGYSDRIVVKDHFVLSIPDGIDLPYVAPLVCAGITTWVPLVEANVGPKTRLGVFGVGGLGHMAVKLAHAFGAHVVAFTSKESKRQELLDLGANEVVVTENGSEQLKAMKHSLDLIIDTVSADHNIVPLVDTLKYNGIYHVLGLPAAPALYQVPGNQIVFRKLKFVGSLIGGLKDTQACIDFCAEKKVLPIIEIGLLKDVNQLMERLEKGDVRYRFVLDVQTSFKTE
jgi:uncharacterized zinc-type alcohol dehydrogenase-like protein